MKMKMNTLVDSSVGIPVRTADTGIEGSNPIQGTLSFFFLSLFSHIFRKNVPLTTIFYFFQNSFICFLVLITPSITCQKQRITFLKVITLFYMIVGSRQG